ncbi:MAG: GTP-dependent dephospho-CoA kinase family protein [Candidatus Caldarchaeum sp.]
MPSKSTETLWSRSIYFSEELKERLRKPLGELRTGELGRDEEVARANPLVVVGDYSYQRLRAAGIKPHVVVVDTRVERRDAGKPSLEGYLVVHVKNPAGSITREAAQAVVKAVENRSGAVLVEGEEDLLALPAVWALPSGGVVVYGQPGAGYVVVKGCEEARRGVVEVIEAAKL